MERNRDIIIITGVNVSGKTTASNRLRAWCQFNNIPYEPHAISDAQSLLEVMRLDDQAGGFHHTHDWCTKNTEYNEGHTHKLSEPELPFVVVDNKLPNDMLHQFFSRLTFLPETNSFYFVEWAAGANTLTTKGDLSKIDYSYAKVKRMLQEGSLPTSWLDRLYMIIHLETSNTLRRKLNQERNIAFLEAIEDGTASWSIDETVLDFYGVDDFEKIEDLFQGIPIRTLKNDGTDNFFEQLDSLTNEMHTFKIPVHV